MVALGVLAGAGRPPAERRRLPALALGAVVVALAVLCLVRGAPARGAERALLDPRARGADYDARAGPAERGASLNPLLARAHLRARPDRGAPGRRARGQARYVDAVELQPENPETWYALGLYEYEVIRDLCAAHEYFERAFALDPVGNQWVPGGPLDVAREAVDDGGCGGARPPRMSTACARPSSRTRMPSSGADEPDPEVAREPASFARESRPVHDEAARKSLRGAFADAADPVAARADARRGLGRGAGAAVPVQDEDDGLASRELRDLGLRALRVAAGFRV